MFIWNILSFGYGSQLVQLGSSAIQVFGLVVPFASRNKLKISQNHGMAHHRNAVEHGFQSVNSLQ
jgi:hypothetical protein